MNAQKIYAYLEDGLAESLRPGMRATPEMMLLLQAISVGLAKAFSENSSELAHEIASEISPVIQRILRSKK